MRLRPWLNSQHETFDVMHSRATDRRNASKCQGKWPDQTLDQAFGLPEVLVAVSTPRLSCKRTGKTRTLMPVWDSSGESQLRGRRLRRGSTVGRTRALLSTVKLTTLFNFPFAIAAGWLLWRSLDWPLVGDATIF